MSEIKKRFLESWGSAALSLLFASVFGYLAFRGIDGEALWRAVLDLSFWVHLPIITLSLLGLGLRGLRWWLLLPRPRYRCDWIAAQRATGMGYAVTNLFSRLGEVVRVVSFMRTSARGLGAATSSVILDRILGDFTVFLMLLGFSLALFGEPMAEFLPGAKPFFWVLSGMTLIGLLVLFGLAVAPERVSGLMKAMGLMRLPVIGPRLEQFLDQFSLGLKGLNRPRDYAAYVLTNLLAWVVAVLMFHCALEAFGINVDGATLMLLFTMVMVGVLIPSPGGLGTYHYLLILGLTEMCAVPEQLAAAVAVYSHGMNYAIQMLYGLAMWLWSPRIEPRDHADNQAE